MVVVLNFEGMTKKAKDLQLNEVLLSGNPTVTPLTKQDDS